MRPKVVVALDYDGVLVDSYRGVEAFYREDARELLGISEAEAELLLYAEFLAEGSGLMREDWWPKLIPGLSEDLYDKLITRYWERRIERTVVLPGVRSALERLSAEGAVIAHVGFRDDIYGLKRERVRMDGLSEFFDEIVVVGEDYPSRAAALSALIEKYKPERLYYVDDKATNLYAVRRELSRSSGHSSAEVRLFKVSFSSLWDFPWKNPGGLFAELPNLLELARLVVREGSARGPP